MIYEEIIEKTIESINNSAVRQAYFGGMNGQEAKLCALHPADCAKVKVTSDVASTTAENRRSHVFSVYNQLVYSAITIEPESKLTI